MFDEATYEKIPEDDKPCGKNDGILIVAIAVIAAIAAIALLVVLLYHQGSTDQSLRHASNNSTFNKSTSL